MSTLSMNVDLSIADSRQAHYVAAHTEDEGVLTTLSENPHLHVRTAVASNPATPKAVLWKLVKDVDTKGYGDILWAIRHNTSAGFGLRVLAAFVYRKHMTFIRKQF